MEFFAYRIKFDENNQPLSPPFDPEVGSYPDSTFNTFLEAFYSVFIVLANDGWSLIYINHFRAVSGFKSTLFFISLLGFGQLILLNIFLAILVSNFDEDSFNSSVI